MERQDLREVDGGERVAGDNEERAIEIPRELPDRSARAERRLLDAVAKSHTDSAAVAVAVLDDRRHVLERHERILDPVALEEVEDVPETGLVDDGHHRLRTIATKSKSPVTEYTSETPSTAASVSPSFGSAPRSAVMRTIAVITCSSAHRLLTSMSCSADFT